MGFHTSLSSLKRRISHPFSRSKLKTKNHNNNTNITATNSNDNKINNKSISLDDINDIKNIINKNQLDPPIHSITNSKTIPTLTHNNFNGKSLNKTKSLKSFKSL
ncbi:uncharacterized protein ASCRUDRAFT_76417, partial [Ascoidea rubescens DSM 1968]